MGEFPGEVLGGNCPYPSKSVLACDFRSIIVYTEGCPAKGLRYCWPTQRSDPLNLIRIMPAKGRVRHLSSAGLLDEAVMTLTKPKLGTNTPRGSTIKILPSPSISPRRSGLERAET